MEIQNLTKAVDVLKNKVQELGIKNAELEVKFYAQSLGTESILQSLGLSKQ